MKTKQGIIGISALLFLVLAAILFFRGSLDKSSYQVIPTYPPSFLPKTDWPLPDAEELALVDAQARVPYFIPLPEGIEIQKVWASTVAVGASERAIAVQFTEDLLLIIHPMAEPPNWDGIIESVPIFVKVNVYDNAGIGTDPGITEANGVQRPYPGSVEWWVDGLDITLYSNTISLEELLKIAQTLR